MREKVIRDSYNHFEVILQGPFDVLLKIKLCSRSQMDLTEVHYHLASQFGLIVSVY